MQSSSVHKPLKIYIDENLPRQFAEAFNIIQNHLNKSEKKSIEVYSMKDIDEGATDIEWFQKLKNENAVILTQDRNIQRHKHEKKAYEENEIGIIFFKQPKGGISFWNAFKHLVKYWDDIKSICRKEKLPFSYRQPGQNKKFQKW
ncbi:hypothetical protein J0X14_18645 [Muricauda sp. CAU 1633]|uniref:PIN-like domain-containing protein n=1 Tax=Allomuricauda sp. CAU 1633 TaxID=2816036 RepID=UPI001A8C06AF|nr:hypothetical protein [Muricauda sp. CAU 1633]MBO0324334.1 hypothetical protein [Muricauda sp. CAU 1633]